MLAAWSWACCVWAPWYVPVSPAWVTARPSLYWRTDSANFCWSRPKVWLNWRTASSKACLLPEAMAPSSELMPEASCCDCGAATVPAGAEGALPPPLEGLYAPIELAPYVPAAGDQVPADWACCCASCSEPAWICCEPPVWVLGRVKVAIYQTVTVATGGAIVVGEKKAPTP